ncbi:MAG: cytochrome c biogenesis protein ResB, partial [Blastocatellia bacterium]
SLIDRFLALLSSVPFGVSLLVILIILSMTGMLIQQQELETFRDYYAKLTPAERQVYGALGLFDIYHTRYFNLILLLVSLSIILASIDYFPRAWKNLRRKKLTASPTFAQTQKVKDAVAMPGIGRADLAARAAKAARGAGFGVKVTEKDNTTTVFAERGAWNRLGAYYIHAGLLTIFLGGFLTANRGLTGGMWLDPGRSDDRMMRQVFNLGEISQVGMELPFEVECLDIQQRLLDKNKGIETPNTLDWLTRVRIRDKQSGHTEEAMIHMNHPYDYKGYRLFQASFQQMGSARSVNVTYTPPGGGAAEQLKITRNGEAKLADGTTVRYAGFMPDFQIDREGKPALASGEYNNAAAQLELVPASGGEKKEAWAFNPAFLKQIEGAPFLKSSVEKLGAGQFTLADYEKVSTAHMLSVQYDPGSAIFYLGSAMLGAALLATFLFAHQRMWIVVEDGQAWLGGDTNRNRLGFEDRMKKVVAKIRDGA